MIDDDVVPVDDPPPAKLDKEAFIAAKPAIDSGQPVTIDLSEYFKRTRPNRKTPERDPILLKLAFIAVASVATIGIAIASYAAIGGCWMILLPLMGIVAFLKNARMPSP